MDKPHPKFGFRVMAFVFKFRDFFQPRKNVLKEVGVKPGSHVLDFGCGPGSYIIPLAALVGESGKIYALDIHSLAIRMVDSIVRKKRLPNVETILSDGKTGLPDNSMDIVLLYDTLHGLGDPDEVLKELYRVLKPDGILSLSDHHMNEQDIIYKLTNTGLFRLSTMGKRTYSFMKED